MFKTIFKHYSNNKEISLLKQELKFCEKQFNQCLDSNLNLLQEIDQLRSALLKIASQETKTANATVRRMANIAREALK